MRMKLIIAVFQLKLQKVATIAPIVTSLSVNRTLVVGDYIIYSIFILFHRAKLYTGIFCLLIFPSMTNCLRILRCMQMICNWLSRYSFLSFFLVTYENFCNFQIYRYHIMLFWFW